MRVLRGRDPRPAVDREHTAALLADASDGTPGVRVWTPPRQVAFGRRDAREPGFGRAKRLAAERGFEPIERDVGGRAVAYPGDTLAFAHALPLVDGRGFESIPDRYERAIETVIRALRSLGAEVSTGEPPESFCPGDHSIRVAGGGKVAGIAQRVRGDAALVAGCLVVTRADASAVADATAAVYDALGVPFDPETVGSVAEANGPEDPKPVARALEDAFVDGPWGDGEPKIDRIDRSG
ncbi:lipoate--protein ligase family protein [Halorubrum lacusprofundi]|uniref:Biotin/lipoate A/B protein ligase n=1 Tax=Halorubrum lacusprofundi (strain ATCC 49239 / DSM 5036 / JCM 8891 / ACAM 34) TaxID=416348 RepID=B9LR50_HALLT|nr:lipoate--protein ligase family protein [Halorubrum lacusprofundi]ACM57704.1 biotin/lipoate A/B protein ligase [Halorubrum lacusprofundi ATCC 49239]MCG1005699.1 lipoate--protein ligase family protein [Halorubrum lacusprofundi]